jgi:DnaB-like helicase C terminal domain
MPATPTGIALLSCLRRLGSSTELAEISESYFTEPEERAALGWLRAFVRDHHAFPGPSVFRAGTQITAIVTLEPITHYKDRARQRALYKEITRRWNAFKDSLDNKNPDQTIEISKEIVALENRFNTGAAQQSFEDVLLGAGADYREAKQTVGLRGITTGYGFLDDETNGWQNTDNVALVGRISDGKSYVAIKHAMAARADGKCVLFQSNEMASLQIARRAIGMDARINPRSIARGEVGTLNEERLYSSITSMREGVPFHCYAGSLTASTAMLRALCERHRPDLIVVDASYLLTPEKKGASRRENLVDVANDLKRISIDFNRPLIHTVQFNRTAVRGKKNEEDTTDAPPPPPVSPQSEIAPSNPERWDAPEPQARQRSRRHDYGNVSHLGLHKIAETDAIAANASIVVAIARPKGKHYEDQRYYTILKGREGERGLWLIHYDFRNMNFGEVTYEEDQAEQNLLTEHMT